MYVEMKEGDKVNEDITQWSLDIQALLNSYKLIFLEPKELFPDRAIDHHIHLFQVQILYISNLIVIHIFKIRN